MSTSDAISASSTNGVRSNEEPSKSAACYTKTKPLKSKTRWVRTSVESGCSLSQIIGRRTQPSFFFEPPEATLEHSTTIQMLDSVYTYRLIKAFSRLKRRDLQKSVVELIEQIVDFENLDTHFG
jgi:hypothetical protein